MHKKPNNKFSPHYCGLNLFFNVIAVGKTTKLIYFSAFVKLKDL